MALGHGYKQSSFLFFAETMTLVDVMEVFECIFLKNLIKGTQPLSVFNIDSMVKGRDVLECNWMMPDRQWTSSTHSS